MQKETKKYILLLITQFLVIFDSMIIYYIVYPQIIYPRTKDIIKDERHEDFIPDYDSYSEWNHIFYLESLNETEPNL